MSKTPYSDRHAEKVRIVADTYDPEALVVPHRKAMALEIERDEARAALREAIGWYTVWGYALRDCKHPKIEDVARWRKAAGLGKKDT